MPRVLPVMTTLLMVERPQSWRIWSRKSVVMRCHSSFIQGLKRSGCAAISRVRSSGLIQR